MLTIDPPEYVQDGRRWTPLTAAELAALLDGTLDWPVAYVQGVPCRAVDIVPETERPRLLVCEGRCNPDIRATDRAVARQYAQYGRLDARCRALLRRLRHTPHDPVDGGRFICLQCRRIRTCGGEA